MEQITLENIRKYAICCRAKLKNIHETCSESFVFLDQMKKACEEINLKMISVGFDPISKIENVPKNPKQRYELMTIEMPKHGK